MEKVEQFYVVRYRYENGPWVDDGEFTLAEKERATRRRDVFAGSFPSREYVLILRTETVTEVVVG